MHRSRIAAALLAALFVFGQLHSTAHFSMVAHETCPLSGQVTHVSHGQSHGQAAHASSQAHERHAHEAQARGDRERADDQDGLAPRVAEVQVAPASEAEAHGDRCLLIHLQEQRRSHLTAAAAACVGPPPEASLRLAREFPAVRRPGLCGYDLAPKQSPPAIV